jgi:hypothetical protein
VTLEDNEIHRVAQQLGLEHADVVNTRSKFRDHLEVLKRGQL